MEAISSRVDLKQEREELQGVVSSAAEDSDSRSGHQTVMANILFTTLQLSVIIVLLLMGIIIIMIIFVAHHVHHRYNLS